jgi:uncharacterized protein (DUF342 family)
MVHPINGTFELKFNDERTLALATIYPSRDGGEPVNVLEVRHRLRALGVSYGIRDLAIREAIHTAEDTHMAATNVVVAQGTVPVDGADASVHYHLPVLPLGIPPPAVIEGTCIPDWLSVRSDKIVRAGQEIAYIVPATPGTPGRTLTWPVHTIPPKPGMPASACAGKNVALVESTRLMAETDGYACLHEDTLTVIPMTIQEGDAGNDITSSGGIVVRANAVLARLRSGGFIAVGGAAVACRLRADDDVIITYAENCEIVTAGSLYVHKGLKNCRVVARKKLIMAPGASLVGGSSEAGEGIETRSIGSEQAAETEVRCGRDFFSDLRILEIQEELTACEANIKRISQTLRRFSGHTSMAVLSDDRRALLHKLQVQNRNLDLRMSELHTERRAISFIRNEKCTGVVEAAGTVWPGVLIEIGGVTTRIEEPVSSVRFQQSASGKSLDAVPIPRAA